MKILLAYLCPWQERHDYFMSMIPYGLHSIAAYLNALKHQVVLANFSKIGVGRAASMAAAEKPQIIGVSIFSFNRGESFAFIKAVKRLLPDVKICLGGPHATFFADEILKKYPEVDVVIKGEGEEVFASYAKALEAGGTTESVLTGSRIRDIDKLPLPLSFSGKTIGINNNEQLKVVITSRGCPDNCSFCSSPQFWSRRVAFRSAESIVDELEVLYKKFGIIYFSIRDDNFTLKKDRVMKVCELIKKRRLFMMWNCQARVDTVDPDMLIAMKQAGLEHIQLGVESGSQKVLQSYNKGISIDEIIQAAAITRKAGIYLSVYLMNGMIEETADDVQKTIKLIKKIKPMDGMLSPVAYYPGTALYDKMKSAGLVTDDIWFESNESGLFARSDKGARIGMEKILRELEITGRDSIYKRADFKQHRVFAGNCWITDIMEGDYLNDEGSLNFAAKIYENIIKEYPENIWGYLRMGSLMEELRDFENALRFYDEARALLPQFFGSWMKASKVHSKLGRKAEAVSMVQEALRLNPYDERVLGLKKKLKF